MVGRPQGKDRDASKQTEKDNSILSAGMAFSDLLIRETSEKRGVELSPTSIEGRESGFAYEQDTSSLGTGGGNVNIIQKELYHTLLINKQIDL